MDTSLEEKYRRDTLTPGELRLLREKLAGSSDEDISSEMERHWMTGDFDDSAISEERVDNLYLDIRKKLAPEKQSRTWIWWSGIAASLLLPLSLFFTARSITTIRQHSDIGLEDFKAHVRRTLCDGEIELNERDIVEIEQIMQTYLTPEFILGNNPRCNLVKQGRIEGVGELEASLELNRNRITAVNLAGDYFLVGDLDDGLLNKLHGVAYSRDALADALADVDVRQIIMNLSTNQFINFLTD